MENVLTRKLERFAPLGDPDRRFLDEVVETRRTVDAHVDIVHEGQSSGSVRLIVDGLAYRYKSLEDGRRQIVAYLVPGDFCDLNVFLLRAMDHSIGTMSRCSVVDIPRHRVLEMTGRPDITRALWWVTLVDEGTLREWLLNNGQRRATERLAHLFCELFTRMQAIGHAKGDSCTLPLLQEDIADTVGLSPVHVNRCLQQLRLMGLIKLNRGVLTILSEDRLVAFCKFDPNYLHLHHTFAGDGRHGG